MYMLPFVVARVERRPIRHADVQRCIHAGVLQDSCVMRCGISRSAAKCLHLVTAGHERAVRPHAATLPLRPGAGEVDAARIDAVDLRGHGRTCPNVFKRVWSKAMRSASLLLLRLLSLSLHICLTGKTLIA